ncbi:MAG TPA: hypothetical protein VFE45_18370, partial [Coriobacteriia bacterium]|nr:hypothetical protein [Coriobacteriia bacterium]
ERRDGQLAVPQERVARMAVFTPDGTPVRDLVIAPGEEITLPSGSTLRLDALDFYARLNVVDDPTVPLLYAAFAIAFIGLTLTVVARQQVVLATAHEGEHGPKLAVALRLWRNSPTNREEIQDALEEALRGAKEDVS